MVEYIEREALLKWALDSMDAQRDVVGKAYCAEFVRATRQFKAADVAPVVHGRWDDSGRYQFPSGAKAIRCSVCGCALRESEYHLFNWNYCPVCGARMDGE